MLHEGKEPQHLSLPTWRDFVCFLVFITLRGSVEPDAGQRMNYIDSPLDETTEFLYVPSVQLCHLFIFF